MELSWTTFALEVVNFLILVWILQRFLYRPVQAAIARRREGVRAALEAARSEREAAETLRQDYEARQAEWAAERERARAALDEEIAAERRRAMTALEDELDAERRKVAALAERGVEREAERHEAEVRSLAAGLAARLLERAASPALERSLIDMAVEDLAGLDEAQLARMREAEGPMEVVSAYTLAATDRDALREAVEARLGAGREWRFSEDPALIAGVRLRVGAWVLKADVADELAFFAGETA
ncbi:MULTISPECIES: F0F1 ATP synthase subunit delta [Arhodomonas]|uniref:F0F1 ATP synthase subunit delta n=2 Tax=Ectothiorhodospiraceae TaxID=72276 RepID=UPI0003654FCF|nr:F0F1 ATP synthase subunit delta [Arhodomonas aquaeolei]